MGFICQWTIHDGRQHSSLYRYDAKKRSPRLQLQRSTKDMVFIPQDIHQMKPLLLLLF